MITVNLFYKGENGIGIFAISTYNTDYILVKTENFDKALAVLSNKGYNIT